MSQFDFAGKNALVIGGGQNIGREVVLEFARRGARVAVADINAAGADETAAMIREAGGEATGIAVDVTSEESVAACVATARAFLGQIDVLMNNAGLLHSGNPEDLPPSEWERIFNVNLFGAVRANALVMPEMIARGSGYIVSTASFAGLFPYAINRIGYAASKCAVVSMSQNLALYLQPKGVHVSVLCPGPIMTSVMDSMKSFGENVPMVGPGSELRLMGPAEVATILADAMEAGKILIPTHEEAFGKLERLGADPDGYVRDKAADFASGDHGRPGR
jgi:NAD(P)-dependent dehydrogenase (short-subunit alcohol dehydrogenase family)